MAKREKRSPRAGAGPQPQDQEKVASNEDDASLVPTTQRVEARHDVGSGEEETDDGLDPMTEKERNDDVPVFDRANRSEKI